MIVKVPDMNAVIPGTAPALAPVITKRRGNPKGVGRPKGAKSKATRLQEQALATTRETMAKMKCTPLEALSLGMHDAVDKWYAAGVKMLEADAEYEASLSALRTALAQRPVPCEEELKAMAAAHALVQQIAEARRGAFREEDRRMFQFGTAAAPYVHSKLAQIEAKVDTSLTIVMAKFASALAKPPEKLVHHAG